MRGFSLSELLIVAAIIAVLALLSMGAVTRAKQMAAFGVSQATMRQVESALSLGSVQVLETYGQVVVPDTSITNQSVISQSDLLRNLLWGFVLPSNVTLDFSFDGSCYSASCLQTTIAVDHVNACRILHKVIFGDGSEQVMTLPKSGPGC